MILLNIGHRTFVTSKGAFAPLQMVDFAEAEAKELLASYSKEITTGAPQQEEQKEQKATKKKA